MKLQPPSPDSYGAGYFDDDARFRARDLLWDHLNDEQRAEYAETRSFIVRGQETKDPYRIHRNYVRRFGDSFCLLVSDIGDHIPAEDQMLAKKILLECDEDLFLRTANLNEREPLRR